MTISEAKKDLKQRLAKEGITTIRKLTGKTVGVGGFGYGNCVFITIHGAAFKQGWKTRVMDGVPKPSEGGYCVDTCECTVDGAKIMFS